MPRELINTGTDKRCVRCDAKGQFDNGVDVGERLAADRRTKAKTTMKAGEGDRGDQKWRARNAQGAQRWGEEGGGARARHGAIVTAKPPKPADADQDGGDEFAEQRKPLHRKISRNRSLRAPLQRQSGQ